MVSVLCRNFLKFLCGSGSPERRNLLSLRERQPTTLFGGCQRGFSPYTHQNLPEMGIILKGLSCSEGKKSMKISLQVAVVPLQKIS